jgi:hypothetical protein
MLAAVPSPAGANLSPGEALTYIPFGFVHNKQSPQIFEESLAQMNAYGIDQMLLPLPKLEKSGVLKLSRTERRNLASWVALTGAYDSAHDAGIVATASLSGKVRGKSLELEEPEVRANIVAAVETTLSIGLGGVSLDLEPYPQSQGFALLLEEIDAAFARRHFTGRLAVTAPADTGRWSASYTKLITARLSQVDPLFYDSERTTASAYEQWVREGLAYYSAHTAPGTRIVPDLPSYGANRWHDPAVENLTTATTALGNALDEGSRVNGAGIFWWWGFYYDEQGEGEYEGARDRETWQTRTRTLAFTP